MGLDMYLYRKTYVKNWEFMQPAERHLITIAKGGEPRQDIKPERITYIIEEVAYWRKANAIHKWFVEKVQGGNDDCGHYYVSREQLSELVALCKQVINAVETVDGAVFQGRQFNPDGTQETLTKPGKVVAQQAIPEKLLPTQGGFFFGCTDYDEYYLEDLKYTVTQLEQVLSEGGDGDFEYHSSW